MIIFIGGLVGAGKSSLARSLSTRLSILHYGIDEVKKVIYPQDPDFEHNMHHGIPFSDETRVKVFERVVEDFQELRKTHSHIIVDETLHKRKLRQILFEGANKYFGGYIIVLVKTNENKTRDRLIDKGRSNHILKDPMKMYYGFAREFESFNESYVVSDNNGTMDETTESVCSLFQSISLSKLSL